MLVIYLSSQREVEAGTWGSRLSFPISEFKASLSLMKPRLKKSRRGASEVKGQRVRGQRQWLCKPNNPILIFGTLTNGGKREPTLQTSHIHFHVVPPPNTHTHTNTHTYTQARTHTHKHPYSHTQIHTHIHKHTSIQCLTSNFILFHPDASDGAEVLWC